MSYWGGALLFWGIDVLLLEIYPLSKDKQNLKRETSLLAAYCSRNCCSLTDNCNLLELEGTDILYRIHVK